MADIEILPVETNITYLGGDTLTIHVTVDSAFVAGRQWDAQVRRSRGSRKIDATLSVIEDATGAFLTLASEDSAALVKSGDYEGFWDVQLSDNGDDPVTTLAMGTLMLMTDVTRLSA